MGLTAYFVLSCRTDLGIIHLPNYNTPPNNTCASPAVDTLHLFNAVDYELCPGLLGRGIAHNQQEKGYFILLNL